ncbi:MULTISPECIES: hypothetical protein [Deinococcus]|uniref:Transcriptional regulator n=1 Tax=Deinococcus rufus TaxID=2136097 RepID=A0ABV7Z9W9_9DEIO|nr:hypothetical protein [Deinococcus sp. AB2017081]WQE94418.1 hypothetical protein U2P90_13515 [Deinococcus sp. AB2017081]
MNSELETLLKANNTSYAEITTRLGFTKGQLRRYVTSDDLTYKFKLLVRLSKAGYTIPYHHRPQCKTCKSRYIPHSYRQYQCSECIGLPGYDLTPSDYKDLEVSPARAAAILGLPKTSQVYSLLQSWDDDQEEKMVQKLKKLTGETGAKPPKKKIQ